MIASIDTSLIDWSRAQFALTAMYHWLFVPLTLGLGVIQAIMETIYYKTGNEFWKKTAQFWMKLFGINFAIGVATGLILEFEFGTNWSNYSWFVGDIFGAPLAIEGILAFFMEATSPKTAPTLMLSSENSVSRFFNRYQLLTPITKTAPTIHPESTVWKNLLMATGDKATAQKSNISLRTVSGLKCIPTGYCIHALAIRIQRAERVAPMIVSQVEAKWKRLLTLSQPKNITAIKVASIKNARIPSIARGAPKMSPTNQL